ncbi:MAG: glycosyltransferase family 4 protein, partial [Cyanobacteria bacterium J06606_4]
YTLSYRLTVLLCKLRKIPIIMQNDATAITDASQGFLRRLSKATLYPWMYGLADYWISSGDHNEIYLRHYGINLSKVVRGCYPVDRDRWETTITSRKDEIQQIRQQLCWDESTVFYGFTGKYIERKNPLEFIDAIARAHQQDPRIRGIMLGGGLLSDEINQRLATLQNDEVINVGFVNQSKLPLYYAAMDVFVSTSLSDPHPLVISEAMAAGTPPILSDRCGNWGYRDTVQHRYNGLVYPCQNISALTEAILTLADNELRQTYSQRSLEVFSGQDLNCELQAFLTLISRMQQAAIRPQTQNKATKAPIPNNI